MEKKTKGKYLIYGHILRTQVSILYNLKYCQKKGLQDCFIDDRCMYGIKASNPQSFPLDDQHIPFTTLWIFGADSQSNKLNKGSIKFVIKVQMAAYRGKHFPFGQIIYMIIYLQLKLSGCLTHIKCPTFAEH